MSSSLFNPPRERLNAEQVKQIDRLSFKSKKKTFLNRLGRTGKRKTVKVMLLHERYELVDPNLPTYGSVRATPSLLPAAKYCDITGLPTRFTDPKTKLHFFDSHTFQQIRQLPQESINKILAKRGADFSLR
jgi:hypothetical protein